ncbi:MAG: S1C family serine protease [Actinomycetota bacterium]|jgi:S1-C subfamily serine protease|nr:S1C family serine protease [Actinomycetota bacterium]MDA8280207.1 S1C family serine protease [Actinomycetota bacterium]
MDRGGSFTGDGAPEDAGDEDVALRGWLPPDDRLWRHPSELGKADADPIDLASRHVAPRGLERSGGGGRVWRAAAGGGRPTTVSGRHPATAVVGAAAIVLAVALVVLVADRPSVSTARPTSVLAANATSLTTAVAPAPRVQASMTQVRRSLVGLVVTQGHQHPMLVTGVATARRLVVTAAAALGRSTHLTAILPDGRRLPASVVATDAHSGVAVVAIDQPVTPATFAGRTMAAGDLAMTECLCGSTPGGATGTAGTTALTAAVALAQIEAVGTSGTGAGPGNTQPLLDVIEADHVQFRQDSWGGVLVDGSGQVAGILDAQTTASGERMDVFVPGWLAQRVAAQLARAHRVVHGWLGITGADAPGTCGGATVLGILPGAPVNGVLAPGQNVVAVDGHQICTWPELQAALYVDSPGQAVALRVAGPGGTRTVAVTLSASPG